MQFIRLIGLLFLGLIAPLRADLTAKGAAALQMLEGIDDEVNQALRDFGVPGVAVALVVDGEVIFAKGYGYRDLEQKLPVTPATIFPVGSFSKSFTAFILGNLVDEGAFDWDTPVIDVLPDFRLKDEYATLNVTIRDIISHHTGLPRHPFACYNSGMSVGEVVKRLRYLEPACNLRQQYHYNDMMYLVAGAVIEKVTGKPWCEVVSERIFRPLGMKSTSCTISEMQRHSDISSPYLERGGVLKRISYRDVSPLQAAGGLNSNVLDIAEWMKVHLGNGMYKGKRMITHATLEEMHSPQTVIGGMCEHPGSLINSYGLGWIIESHNGYYNLSHHGGLDGFTCHMSLLPTEGVGVVVLGNRNLSMLPYVLTLCFLDRALGVKATGWISQGLKALGKDKQVSKESPKKFSQGRRNGTKPLHSMEAYEGEYYNPGYGTMKVEAVGDQLHATLHGLTMVLDHWHFDEFIVDCELQDTYYPRDGLRFSFRNDNRGDVGEVAVPFEPTVSDIIFKKRPNPSQASFAYLMQFVGPYDLDGRTVEIVLRGHTLCALIAGVPQQELVSVGNVPNEFTVKAVPGLSIRFIMNEHNQVEEVLLIHPYGAQTAKPKK